MGMEKEGLRLPSAIAIALALAIADCGLWIACCVILYSYLLHRPVPRGPVTHSPRPPAGKEGKKVYSTRFGHGVFLGKNHPLWINYLILVD